MSFPPFSAMNHDVNGLKRGLEPCNRGRPRCTAGSAHSRPRAGSPPPSWIPNARPPTGSGPRLESAQPRNHAVFLDFATFFVIFSTETLAKPLRNQLFSSLEGQAAGATTSLSGTFGNCEIHSCISPFFGSTFESLHLSSMKNTAPKASKSLFRSSRSDRRGGGIETLRSMPCTTMEPQEILIILMPDLHPRWSLKPRRHCSRLLEEAT